jgi:hypothetical protein
MPGRVLNVFRMIDQRFAVIFPPISRRVERVLDPYNAEWYSDKV